MLVQYQLRFGIDAALWQGAASAAGELDALRSLALFSFENTGDFCRPEVVKSDHAFVEIKGMQHPCVSNLMYGHTHTHTLTTPYLRLYSTDFIQNDLTLGSKGTSSVLFSRLANSDL